MEKIFLPELFSKHEGLADSMFMFGFGRLLSPHNKLGASRGSDMDSNVIVGALTDYDVSGMIVCAEDYVAVMREAMTLAQRDLAGLGIELENNPEFTVRSFDAFEEAISSGNPAANKSLQFYISIQNDYYRFHTPEGQLESIFLERIEIFQKAYGQTTAQAFFEETLNDSGKYSIGIIHGSVKTETNAKRHLTITDKKKVSEVIGSGNETPDNWYFSLKYTANRFYDFLYKLESIGAAPQEAGLTVEDLLFIKNINNMALALQNYAYARHPDNCGYLSADDFQELYAGTEFRKEFKIIAQKSGISLGLLELAESSLTGDYKKLGHTFFKKLDEKMFKLHQKIAISDVLKGR
jgi:hypothetical protein